MWGEGCSRKRAGLRDRESKAGLSDSDYSFNDVRLAIAFATTSRSFALSIGFGT